MTVGVNQFVLYSKKKSRRRLNIEKSGEGGWEGRGGENGGCDSKGRRQSIRLASNDFKNGRSGGTSRKWMARPE